MSGLVSIIGLAMLSAGASCYSWPAGLMVFGAGLYFDAILPRNRRVK